MQAESSADDQWAASLSRIMSLTAGDRGRFASQPFANRLEAILEAVVPSRKNPTHEKVLAVVNALIETGAIRRDEGAGVYDALLQRVSKYNSLNAQTNLDRLVGDVREAVAKQVRNADSNLGSLAALNAFLARLPATVQRGQDNYSGFISALRLLVSEAPSTEVYQSGPSYFLQSTRNGTQTVNLTAAFENLSTLWGVKAPTAERLSISALLTPNTRLLLLLVAPFTDSVSVSRDSYVGYLLTLYREALGQANVDERTLNEITHVSRALGDGDASHLQATLNFLLTNRVKKHPVEYDLTETEERILRYVQQAVSLRIMQDHMTPTQALDVTSANLEPSFYASNRVFINKLMDFLHRAASVAPDYFLNAVLNPRWLPPEGFFTGVFDFPERDESYIWDEERDQSLINAAREEVSKLEDRFLDEDQRSVAGAEAPPLPASRPSTRAPTPVDDLYSLVRIGGDDKNFMQEMGNLATQLGQWKTYKQESADQVQALSERRRRRHSSAAQSDDGMDLPDRFLSFQGSGRSASRNPFAHLRPKHLR
uniref:Pre-hexon-linking protein IIIa n=1 Tax=Cardioderma bat adenovirus TaxID=3141913 RepID=A0AAU7E1L0_9ADEN